MTKDLLLFNAYIPGFALPEGMKEADALLVRDGAISSVGYHSSILEEEGSVSTSYDLEGKTLLPGFTDSHVHLVDTGMEMVFWVDLSPAVSLDDVYSLLKAAEAEKGTWITASGFDQDKLKERRYPTRGELDQLELPNPIFIRRRDGHSSCLNSRAFDVLAPFLSGLEGIEKDDSGQATGTLRAAAHYKAMERVVEINFSRELCREAVFRASERALSKGVTTVHALMGGTLNPPGTVSYFLEIQDSLPIRTVLWNQTMKIQELLEQGLNRIGGCIILDGAIGSQSAALFEPYSDAPGSSGCLYNTQGEMDRFISEAHSAGLQIAIHAIGDRAIEQALASFEKAMQKNPRKDPRHRIEHFILPEPRQILKAAELGLFISTQPAFEYYWGGKDNTYGQRLGPERVLRTHPLRSLIRAGLTLCGGSDSFVTPVDPLLGIHAAVNHPNPEERITLEEACKMFTINPAISVFEEEHKGLLVPGYLADLVVLGDKLQDGKSVKDIPVAATFVGGELRYESAACRL